MFRQGDVLLRRVDAVPKDATPVAASGGRIILAYGEATGHHHALPAAHAALLAKGAERFLRVDRVSTLSHEEHNPIQLPAGNYEVIIQREYDPTVISRAVVD